MLKKNICNFLKIRESNNIISIIILASYRLSNKIYNSKKIPIIYRILMIFVKIINFVIRVIFGIELPYECIIGDNFLLAHGGREVVIHPKSKIGDNVSIYHNVTIGGTALAHYIMSDGSKECVRGGVPIIGNGVLIGASSSIIGSVKIGNNVKVGANTVVTKSIDDNSTVISANIRIIK